MGDVDISLCVWIWSLLRLLNKTNNWMSGVMVPSQPWERQTAHGVNHLPIVWEASHALYDKYEGPNFYLGHPLYTQNKDHNVY